MKNIDIKQVAIYGGLALLAYKIFNTKISVSTGLTEKKEGINLNVTGGSSAPLTTNPQANSPQPDRVVDVPGAVSTAPVNPYLGIAPGSSPYDQIINVVW
ncbi:hypothetical protein [Elizabethkingia anophelis]|uniref:hypothetical protein n=1 Tax=Elizabethkingia anophelis TaxID=1117645 RepID=UPI002013874C|nr:hypothetical protein [Elizabethkingia anophelis]EJC8061038.1 hypothetical protein [Elizabethkingia anophelis]MCL1640983.1 hypothetical protein [Elizabethkingia anophelis]MCL1646784.1 hypothetical protein [Elizabethkingia anophelis]MDV3779780.1 hypothetical protein [Elizabethkingia anophelis]MDV3789656.1 hypothetical protein [Elizabethkingia anophelis]